MRDLGSDGQTLFPVVPKVAQNSVSYLIYCTATLACTDNFLCFNFAIVEKGQGRKGLRKGRDLRSKIYNILQGITQHGEEHVHGVALLVI